MTRKSKVLFGRFFNSLNIFNLPKTLISFGEFDDITRFRLINSFVVAFSVSMLLPVLTVLQGTLMVAWAISLFKIIEMISVKSNEFFVHSFKVKHLYKMTVILHLFYIFSASIYFFSPLIMVYADSMIAILEMAIIGAFSIALNNYLADEFPKSMSRFQIVRNSSWADGSLISLLITTVSLYFFPMYVIVIMFIIINSIFSIWLIKNWRFYDKLSI